MTAEETFLYIDAGTQQAVSAIGAQQLAVDQSPFRFGRESRDKEHKGWLSNRRVFSKPNNECYMHDTGYFRQISREHFQIRQGEDRTYWLKDRGSSCGTWVNGKRLTADSGECDLRNGDKIVVGTAESSYIYTFVTPTPS